MKAAKISIGSLGPHVIQIYETHLFNSIFFISLFIVLLFKKQELHVENTKSCMYFWNSPIFPSHLKTKTFSFNLK